MNTEKAYRFSSFRLDPQTWRLRKNSEFRPLRPKTFSILRYLLDNAGQLVSKEDLFKEIWPGVNVENSALRVCMNELRQALDDDPHRPRFVETVHRRGYRFIAPVDMVADDDEEPAQLLHAQSILVGRESESARFLQCWELALTGTRQMVFVAGEPGIGKTSVVDKLLSAPLVSRFAIAGRGQCAEQYGKGEAYLPVFEALAQICSGRRGKNAREILEREAPSWMDHLPQLSPSLSNGAGVRTMPSQMLAELGRALNAIATKRPVMLVFEDLHLSDQATVDLIGYLAKRRDPARLMMVGTYRTTAPRRDLAHLAAVVRDLEGHRQCVTMRLRGLTETEVANYLDHRISRPLSPALVAQVHERTGGNPLFMTAIVDHLESLGAAGRSWPDDLRDAGVPDNIHAMIEQQIEELSAADQKLLKLASVAGATGLDFSSAAVAAALHEEGSVPSQDDLEEKSEQLARRVPFFRAAGVSQWPDGTIAASYGFGHALYQEVLYGLLSAGQRARSHLRIARRLEQAYGAKAPRIALELAMHFERGGDNRRAAEHLNGAADTAISRGSSREALAHVEKALKLLKTETSDQERMRMELRLEATRALALSACQAPLSRIEATMQRMSDITGEIGSWAVQLMMFQAVTKLMMTPGDSAGEMMMKSALNHCESAPELAPLRSHAHMALCTAYNMQGKFRTALSHGEQAIETYDPALQSPAADSKIFAIAECAAAQWYLGYPEQARKRAAEAIALAERMSHAPALAVALAPAATIHSLIRESKTAIELSEKLVSFASDKDLKRWRAWGVFLRGGARVEMGDLDEGCRMMRSALNELDARDEQRVPATTVHARANLRYAEFLAGMLRPHEAADAIRADIEECCQLGALGNLSDIYRLLALVKAAEEKPKPGKGEAEQLFRKAIEIAHSQCARSFELRAALDLGHLLHRQGRDTPARRLLVPIYARFTEGHSTPDLKAAKTLLDEL